MHSLSRRAFLALAGLSALPTNSANADDELFVGARINSGRFEVAVVNASGRDRLILPVNIRKHSFAIDAGSRTAVAFARSPGRHAVLFGVDGGREPVAITATPGRHFFGHGAFARDGRLLIASENDYEAGLGVAGIYSIDNGTERIGEISTGGVGPHELVLLPDGRTVCVANGGILTHPDYRRVKLNLDTMKPSLAYFDIANGELIERVELAPELHRLSIRHLAVDRNGSVWFGCQWEGDALDRPPLVGRHVRGKVPELFAGPPETLRSLKNYVGSVAVDASGEIVATSSPHGGLVAFWDAASGRHLGDRKIADGCGIAPLGSGRIMATSGRGAVADLTPQSAAVLVEPDQAAPAWDNHLRRVA
jgi:hypothetical protein